MESIFREPSDEERELKLAYDALYSRLKSEQASAAAAGGSLLVVGTNPQRDNRLAGSSKRLETPLSPLPKKQRHSVVNPSNTSVTGKEGGKRVGGETEAEVGHQLSAAADLFFAHLADRKQPYGAKREMFSQLKERFAKSNPPEFYDKLSANIKPNLLAHDTELFKLHRQINAYIYTLMMYDMDSMKLRVTLYKLKLPPKPVYQPTKYYHFPSVIVHTALLSKNIVFYAPLTGMYNYGVRNDSRVRANEVTKISHDVLPEQIQHASNVCVALWNSVFAQQAGLGLYLFYFADNKTALSSSNFFSCIAYSTVDEPSAQIKCQICVFVNKLEPTWTIMNAIYEDEFDGSNVYTCHYHFYNPKKLLNPSVYKMALSTLEIQNNKFGFVMEVTEQLLTKEKSAINCKAKPLFKMKIDGGKFGIVFGSLFIDGLSAYIS